jgi:hypothetical protein
MIAIARAVFTFAAGAALAFGGPHSAAAVPVVLAQSTFDAGDEGWRVTNGSGAVPVVPGFEPSGGNPDGHVRAEDVQGTFGFWSAPAVFLGDQAAAHGGSLAFDLQILTSGSPVGGSDVLLVSDGLSLVFDIETPTAEWRTYAIPLVAGAGWKVNVLTGADATTTQIRSVLGALTHVLIKQEFISGPDDCGLDNVILTAELPEPAAAPLLGSALVALALARGCVRLAGAGA